MEALQCVSKKCWIILSNGFKLLSLIQCVLKEIFVWSMGPIFYKDELKSVTIMSGALCVMTVGTLVML